MIDFNAWKKQDLVQYIEFLLHSYRVMDGFWFLNIERDHSLEEACRIIQKGGARIVGVSLTQLRGNRPVHLFRLDKTDLDPIVKNLTRAGHKVISSLG